MIGSPELFVVPTWVNVLPTCNFLNIRATIQKYETYHCAVCISPTCQTSPVRGATIDEPRLYDGNAPPTATRTKQVSAPITHSVAAALVKILQKCERSFVFMAWVLHREKRVGETSVRWGKC